MAYAQFSPGPLPILVFGRDALSGVPAGPVAPASVLPASSFGKRLTYRLVDLADNSSTVVVAARRRRAHFVSLQYGDGPVLTAPPNAMRFEWELARNGILGELEQEMVVRDTGEVHRVEAEFEASRNRTVIEIEAPEPERRLTLPGLVLLRMSTGNGHLKIEF